MAKKKVERPGAAGESASPTPSLKLTYREERFLDAYLRNGCNATEAYYSANPGTTCTRQSASQQGHVILKKLEESGAIDRERERIRKALAFGREEALRILVGMAMATVDDFTNVLRNPGDPESYAGLGDKRYALLSADESFKNGNSIKLVDRKAVINDLWEKLGLGEEVSKKDRLAIFERLFGANAGADRESEKDAK